jgi:hypothetical protein
MNAYPQRDTKSAKHDSQPVSNLPLHTPKPATLKKQVSIQTCISDQATGVRLRIQGLLTAFGG